MQELIYLAGKIDGLTWEEANGWRKRVIDELSLRDEYGRLAFYNPLCHVLYLSGKNVKITPETVRGTSRRIVVDDEFYLKKATVVLANLEGNGMTGTLCEIGYARALGKLIVGFGKSRLTEHPFIKRWVDIHLPTLEEAIDYLDDLLLGMYIGR